MSAAVLVFKVNWVFKVFASCSNTRSKSPSKWQGCLISELLWQTISKAVYSSAMSVSFGVCSVPVSQPHMIIQWIEIWRLNISEVIRQQGNKSESQFNYLFALKNSSNSYNFW